MHVIGRGGIMAKSEEGRIRKLWLTEDVPFEFGDLLTLTWCGWGEQIRIYP